MGYYYQCIYGHVKLHRFLKLLYNLKRCVESKIETVSMPAAGERQCER